MKSTNFYFGIVFLFCAISAYFCGIRCGRKQEFASHLMFNMAVHSAAVSQYEKIPPEILFESSFDMNLQIQTFARAISQIDYMGFEKLLQDRNGDGEDLLENIYSRSKQTLAKYQGKQEKQ